MVDDENSYGYELDGLWTDSEDVVSTWFKCGVKQVVALDALSMELVTSYDQSDWADYLISTLEDLV